MAALAALAAVAAVALAPLALAPPSAAHQARLDGAAGGPHAEPGQVPLVPDECLLVVNDPDAAVCVAARSSCLSVQVTGEPGTRWDQVCARGGTVTWCAYGELGQFCRIAVGVLKAGCGVPEEGVACVDVWFYPWPQLP